jgi:hypothetical protein
MSNIKVGDIVKIKDISYACMYKDSYGYVPFCGCGWDIKYKVIDTGLVLPSITMDGRRGQENDTILECVDKNHQYELIYIRAANLTLAPRENKLIAQLQSVVDDLTNRLNNMTQLNHILEAIIELGAEFYTSNNGCPHSLWVLYKGKPSIYIGGGTVVYSALSNPIKTTQKQISFKEAKNIFATMKKNYSWTFTALCFEEVITQSPHVLISN